VRTAAILPVKRFPVAKSRLGGAVGEPSRRELAEAMAGDVMAALAEVEALGWTIVVTAEPAAAVRARELGACVVEDPEESGQSAAAGRGIARALAMGAERVLCVPGDCPALEPGEVADLLRSHERGGGTGVLIVPDRHGTGTNALLLSPPTVIAPSFGTDSCERHRRLAAAAGASCELAHPPSLLLDVDTGADLRALRDRLAGEPARAPLTRALLSGLAIRAPDPVRA